MTTRDYAEAYEDDSENVRSDAQEPEPDPAPCNCPEHLTYRAALAFNSDREWEFALEGDPLAMWDEIVDLRILCGKAADHLERVMAERDEARATIAERDASIARLTTRLAADVENGTETTSELGAPCPESSDGQSWTGVNTNYGRRWRCDTCGRIVSQDVSNPMQAADDRRSL